MKILLLPAVMLYMTVFLNVVHAQQVEGIVKSDKNQPIQNVAISINQQIVAKTNARGVFTLPDEYALPVELRLKHPDYQVNTILFSQPNQTFNLKELVVVEELNTIVVMAPSQITSEVMIPTTFITQDALEQQSPIALVEAINKTAGVHIQSGAINTNRITIRGVGSRTLYGTNKIKAYFNGIPITNGVGETALDSYDPEDLNSIEVIKGPKATLYGTNLGGTILLNSKSASRQGVSIRNNTTIGSYGLFKNSISTDYSDQNITLHVAYDHLETEGFRDNSNYNRNSYFINASYQLAAKTQLSMVYNHTNYEAQIPSSIGRTDYLEMPSKAAFTWSKAKGYEDDDQQLLGLSITQKFSDNFENTTSIFYAHTNHYEPRPFNILDEITEGMGLRSVFSNTFEVLGKNAVWNFGTELYKDTYQWKTLKNLYASNEGEGSLEGALLSDNEEDRNSLNVFSSITLPIMDKITLQFGVNVNKTSYTYQDRYNGNADNSSVARSFDPIFAPNLNLSYQITPQQQFFGNMSYGFNYPSLEETLTPDGVINPEISPEKGYNYELGYEAHLFDRRWHVLSSYYILDIKDLLVAQRVGDDQYIGKNAGRTLHQGLEFSTEYRYEISKNVQMSPYVNASFNWHIFKVFVSDANVYSGNDLTGVPNLTLASGMVVKWNRLSLFANHLYVGEMPINDANSLYSDAYNLINMKLNYTGEIFNTLGYKLHFGVNNLADTAYASSILINATGFNNSEPRYYYPGNPRNYYGGVSFNYHF